MKREKDLTVQTRAIVHLKCLKEREKLLQTPPNQRSPEEDFSPCLAPSSTIIR